MPPGPFVNDVYELTGAALVLNAPSSPFTVAIARSSARYNGWMVDLYGTVTATGGAVAGYGSADIIDRFSVYCTPGQGNSQQAASMEEFPLVLGVRFFALQQFSYDFGYAPIKTDAGSGGSTTAGTQFVLPLGDVHPEDSLRIELTTGALATFHTTATAINLTLTIRPILYAPGKSPATVDGAWIGYKETIVDAQTNATQPQFLCKPGTANKWQLGCVFTTMNTSSRGSLADAVTWQHVIVGGKYIAGNQTPYRIHKLKAAIKMRLAPVTGLQWIWFSPTLVSNADYAEMLIAGTSTVAGSTILWVYKVSR
jgi:hypothetical protein